jgi:hypothetical protein
LNGTTTLQAADGRHFPLPMGLSHDGALMYVPGDRHGYRHGEKGLNKRFLVTMTVVCDGFLVREPL